MQGSVIMKTVIPEQVLEPDFFKTNAQPKEMLPVYDKPTLQHLVEEAVTAGIDDILSITGKASIQSRIISTSPMNLNTVSTGRERIVTLKKSGKSPPLQTSAM